MEGTQNMEEHRTWGLTSAIPFRKGVYIVVTSTGTSVWSVCLFHWVSGPMKIHKWHHFPAYSPRREKIPKDVPVMTYQNPYARKWSFIRPEINSSGLGKCWKKWSFCIMKWYENTTRWFKVTFWSPMADLTLVRGRRSNLWVRVW